MSKKSFVILSCILVLLFCKTVYATYLPIDITAIGRQELTGGQVTTRIGANLFTADSQRVNELLAERIQHRQDTALYLFASVPLNYEINPHAQVMNTASDMALFAQPVSFSRFNPPQEEEFLPLWLMILIIAACSVGGFIWALVSKEKRKRREQSVH